jgi:mannose-6-phosphate isomerase-like protein (cupin superfamily)
MGEGLTVTDWIDGPGTVYPVQTQEHLQVHWVLRGELRVGLPERDEELILGPGDRLDLPPNTPYWVDVYGNAPVVYLSATRNHHSTHKK